MSMTTSTPTPSSTAARLPPPGTSRRRALSASAQAAASPATPTSREQRAAAAQSQAVRSYEVRITTGNRRGASTTAAVYVRLIGKYANTQRIEVPGEFTRDTTVVAVIKTPHPLGRIRIVEVGHDNVGDLGVGWYLESIELIELKDSASTPRPQEYHHHQQQRAAHGTMPAHQIPNLQEGDVVRTLMFPVRRWLGKSDIGVGNYPTSVQLRVGIADSMTDPTSFMLPGAQLIKGTKAEPFFIKCGAAAFPHPEKVRNGERGVVRPDIGHAGEDAYSIATVRTPDRNALEELGKLRAGSLVKSKLPTTVTISVCDGVYQWRDKGIDAGEWSRHLSRMLLYQGQHHVRDPDAQDSIQSERWTQSYKDLGLSPPLVPLAHPSAMLKAAEERIRETEHLGSSTACVASLHGLDNMMFVACLGDSGVLVYRKSMGVIFRTPEQEHAFGYPFQLGHHDVSDHASDALVSHCRITSGDVVIVASDGLFDNLFESQISKILDKHMDTRNAQLCATELASEAYANSISERTETPYSHAAGEEFNLVWCGGKKDDISVVVAFIVDK